jgi:D-sedoheptulose 7-phosphate isomerase
MGRTRVTNHNDISGFIRDELLELAQLVTAAADSELPAQIALAADWCIESLRAGGTIYYMGNGGSAAEAIHLAAELGGRLELDRAPLPAVALGTNPSTVTAIGNDYSFEEVFEREVAIVRPGDVVFALTTSGRSPNVLRAMAAAHARNARVIAITGRSSDELPEADLHLRIPAPRTRNVQEISLAMGHLICQLVERAMVDERPA